MSKYISLALTFMMILVNMSAVSADDDGNAWLELKTDKEIVSDQGEELIVTVALGDIDAVMDLNEDILGISSFSLNIKFDGNVFQPAEFEGGSKFKTDLNTYVTADSLGLNEEEPGSLVDGDIYRVTFQAGGTGAGGADANLLKADGDLFQVKLALKEDAPLGTTPILIDSGSVVMREGTTSGMFTPDNVIYKSTTVDIGEGNDGLSLFVNLKQNGQAQTDVYTSGAMVAEFTVKNIGDYKLKAYVAGYDEDKLVAVTSRAVANNCALNIPANTFEGADRIKIIIWDEEMDTLTAFRPLPYGVRPAAE